MRRGKIIQVDPGELRLPPGRFTGSDPLKLSRQIKEFGSSTAGMPPIQVTEGAGGERMINDGVTRAVRVCKLSPGAAVQAEVIEVRPNWDFTSGSSFWPPWKSLAQSIQTGVLDSGYRMRRIGPKDPGQRPSGMWRTRSS